MKKQQIILALVLLVLALVLSSFFLMPHYYLADKSVEALEVNDELVIADESYLFQTKQYAEDGLSVNLGLLDENGSAVETTVASGTPLVVKVQASWWQMSVLPPPTPMPVLVPVPIPTPVPAGVAVPTVIPAPTPTPTPVPPITVPIPLPVPPTTGIAPSPSYPSTCSDGVWNGDESDLDCGGQCPQCLNTGMFTACWDNGDCTSGNCDTTNAQRPLPSGHTISTLRNLAGQMWIIPYEGVCR